MKKVIAVILSAILLVMLMASCGEPTPTQPSVSTHVGFNGNTWNDNVDTGVNVETVAAQDENGYYFVDHTLVLNKLDKRFMTEIELKTPIALNFGNDELKVSNRTYYSNTNVKYVTVNVTNAGKLTVSKANVADFMAGKAELVSSKTVDATVGAFKIELDMYVGFNETIVIGSNTDTAKIATYTVTTDAQGGGYIKLGGETSTARLAVDTAVEVYKSGALYSEEEYGVISKFLYGNVAKYIMTVANNAAYATKNTELLSGKRISTVYLPVARVTTATDGKYIVTIHVIDKASYAIKRSYTIELNGADYGWKDKDVVFETVVVDVSDLNIVTDSTESIGFLTKDDTVSLAISNKAQTPVDIMSVISKNNTAGAIVHIGKDSVREDNNTSMLVNVVYNDLSAKATLEDNIAILKAQEEKAVADAKEAAYFDALRAYYKDKNVSVIGDSISTYSGWNNNTKYNSTIGNNAVYYSDGILTNVKYTYWMRVIDQLGMKFCVNNAWSGCKVYEKGVARAVLRATEMDNDNGTPNDPSDDINPDVILMYIGINDLDASVSFGDLNGRLKNAEKSEYNGIIKEWFDGVLQLSENGTQLAANKNYKTFEQGYAIMLYNMTKKYEGVKIVCCTLIPNKVILKDDAFDNYQRVITALAEYFGATVADFRDDSGIDRTNYETYMVDPAKALHPNAIGHDMMADVIIDALAQSAGITK